MPHDERNPLSPHYRPPSADRATSKETSEYADLVVVGIAWIVSGALTIAVMYGFAFLILRYVFGIELPNTFSQ